MSVLWPLRTWARVALVHSIAARIPLEGRPGRQELTGGRMRTAFAGFLGSTPLDELPGRPDVGDHARGRRAGADGRVDGALPGLGLLPEQRPLLGRALLVEPAEPGDMRILIGVVAGLQAVAARGQAVEAERAVAADAGLAADDVV